MRFSVDTLNQIRSYEDIVSFIGTYVALKRRGRNYLGLCPFHSERSPSFTVSPDKKIFHCFGCHASGDLIEFVRKIENLTFSESVSYIADRIGVSVSYDESSPQYHSNPKEDALKDSLRSLLHLFFVKTHQSLLESEQATQYFLSRGVSEESLSLFLLGYCEDLFPFASFISENGFSEEVLLKSGVFYKNEVGHFVNRFQGRLLFPIMDHLGNPVGLSGRVWKEDQQGAKYVNSEETTLFNKRKTLYGLHLAKRAIRDEGSAILVEGYMDAMLLQQHGFLNAVAVMGTAITTEQLSLLKRFTQTVYLNLDQDESGQTAIERSLVAFLSAGFTVYVLSLDEKDPADFLNSHGKDMFKEKLKQAQSMVMFLYGRLKKRYDLSKVENVSLLLDELKPFLIGITDELVKRHYITFLSSELNVAEELIVAKIFQTEYTVARHLYKNAEKKYSKQALSELYVLYVSIQDLKWRQLFFELLSTYRFVQPEFEPLRTFLLGSSLYGQDLLHSLGDSELKQKISEVIFYGDHYHFSLPIKEEWKDYMFVLEEVQKQEQVVKLKQELKELELSGDQDRIAVVLQELQQLKRQ